MSRLSLALFLSALTLTIAFWSAGCRESVNEDREVDGPIPEVFSMDGSSMEPTISDGDQLRISNYGDRSPQRGDVVLFRFPADTERQFIKRIIAGPGETVELRDGLVFIDGSPIEEPYITGRAYYSYGPEKIPANNYFVLGDNRNSSYDSHVWGFVPRENIIGRVNK